MKIIIAGSRDLELVEYYIDDACVASRFKFTDDTEIVNGMCPTGIDKSAREFARAAKWPVKEFPADWKKHGRAAGPIRNGQMADYADALIAIYRKGRLTPGTRDMIRQARAKGLKVYEHEV